MGNFSSSVLCLVKGSPTQKKETPKLQMRQTPTVTPQIVPVPISGKIALFFHGFPLRTSSISGLFLFFF